MKKSSSTIAGRRAVLAAAFMALGLSAPAMAQDAFSIDEDAMFGSEDMVDTVTESEAGSAVKSLLVSESVRIGGRFSGSAASSWTWNDPWEGDFDITATNDYGLTPSLSALLFFDARPTEESRFYGSLKTSWPFTTSTSVIDSDGVATGDTVSLPNIEVFELFSDFSWNDSLYFRFGKQTVNWGVGYFFSPANILNLQEIDPTDPTAQLEGPVALRALYPIPGTQHNLWAYTVFDSATMKPEDTAVAAKAEFVFGGWELGVGGYYQKDDPIRGMLTASGSVGQFSVFGEATVSRGSEKEWVTSVSSMLPGFVSTETDDESIFFQGTTGFRYTNSDANITVMGQYLYDGEGYSNADREERIDEATASETAIKIALAASGQDADEMFSRFLKGLIYGSGQHYAAATFSKSELLVDDLSFSVFAMGNLSDFSGFIKPSLSYAFFDGLSLSASASFALGFDNGEYVVLNDGQAMSLSVTLTLGSGAF
ncbi:MAG: hypothetical protein A2Y38_11910 [Spirochaetes bacterium GWB1_59_5]|nr:MAG: hypothetical protein A2Y38_11910 [Spirochaetes bacterium GWB1_59_5]